ncbi:MAG TPA: hypothetical protein VII06_00455 [Chloroflexota bacterium]
MAALDWLIVALFGAFVGIGELVSRYRDAPDRALTTLPALLYTGLNTAAALAALGVIRAFGWTFGVPATPNADALRWTQVAVAGFGAMALFRSSLFTVRIGEQDVAVGPSSFLQIVLAAADRAVDRLRAQARAATVCSVMANVSFAKANVALPTLCLALMQNLPKDDQEQFARQLAALRSVDMDDRMKTLSLGLALMNVVGEDVLLAAVTSLGADIRDTPALPPP